MLRRFIIKNEETKREVVLPVTPKSFLIDNGIRIETVNIHTVGDVNLAGYSTLANVTIDCMFPCHKYPFNQPETSLNPYSYVEFFEVCSQKRQICRFIISDTLVNMEVLIENIHYGEQDGTNDIYATLTLRQYRRLKTASNSTVSKKTASRPRVNTTPPVTSNSYEIKKGDTLGAICRKYYGDSSLATKLSKYNGIKNPNIIYAGKALKLPSKNLL